MKFSLLSKNPEKKVKCEVIYDLSLDRAVKRAVSDPRRADYFLSVLENPLSDVGNIVYRQQVFADLCDNGGLFDELQLIFTRYDRIKSDWHEMKLSSAPSGLFNINPEALLEHTYSSLKITAIFPSTIAAFYKSLADALEKYDLHSECLVSMRDYCAEMLKNDSLNELTEIARLFRYHSPEHFTFGVSASVGADMRLSECDLCDIAEYSAGNENLLKKLFTKAQKSAEGTVQVIDEDEVHKKNAEPRADDTSADDGIFMLNEALGRIDAALTQATNGVYETFFGLSRELMFYEAGMLIFRDAASNGLPVTMPGIKPAEADCFHAENLYEFLLACEGKNDREIVENSLDLDSSAAGILVRGMTDTGKTVFLRAVGAAQLLAQAGLPVLAEKAEMSVRHGFFSHFSSAEEEFLRGDAAGRFDGEAKEIARILDEIVPYSMVFLNETFQTTSYSEGTEGIYNILSVFPRLKTKFVFVTHLTRLFEREYRMKVILAHTSDTRKYGIETDVVTGDNQ